jgi:hypothetical protein
MAMRCAGNAHGRAKALVSSGLKPVQEGVSDAEGESAAGRRFWRRYFECAHVTGAGSGGLLCEILMMRQQRESLRALGRVRRNGSDSGIGTPQSAA